VLRALGRSVLWSSLHGAALVVDLDRVLGRGFHLSTFHLNLSRF
jgi:hypothetical protein